MQTALTGILEDRTCQNYGLIFSEQYGIKRILQWKKAYAIMPIGKRENSSIMVQKTNETPQSGNSEGFLFRFGMVD